MKSYLKLTPKDRLEEFMESYLEKGSNKFELDSFYFENDMDRKSSLVTNYLFNIRDYAHLNEDEIYVNLGFDKIYLDSDLQVNRIVPYETEFKNMADLTTILVIPEGYEVTYLPESKTYKGDSFWFTFAAKQEGNKIIKILKYNEDFLLLEKDRFEDLEHYD